MSLNYAEREQARPNVKIVKSKQKNKNEIIKKNMANKEPGYVYILTNPSFREDWVKIGKSSRPVDVRSKELDNTAVPLPFEIFATMKTVKYNEVEKLVHKTIDRLTDLRMSSSMWLHRWLLIFSAILPAR